MSYAGSVEQSTRDNLDGPTPLLRLGEIPGSGTTLLSEDHSCPTRKTKAAAFWTAISSVLRRSPRLAFAIGCPPTFSRSAGGRNMAVPKRRKMTLLAKEWIDAERMEMSLRRVG